MFPSLLCTSLVLFALGAEEKAGEFSVGDLAPRLEIQEFVRGEPVKQFDHGKTYVVEFWATWCAPCRKSMPRLTALQKKYPDAIFLGVSIDKEVKEVKPFVEKAAGKIGYRVALEAHDGETGKMEESWLAASNQGGIPATFLVNGDGKVAWIGHPDGLEEPLKQVLAGKWDLAVAAAEHKRVMAEQQKQAAVEGARKEFAERMAKALQESRYDDALKLAEEAEAKEFTLDELDPAALRLAILTLSGKQTDKAVEIGKKLLARTLEKGGDIDPLMIVAAIGDPQRIFKPEQENEAGDPHPAPARKLDPALAKIAASAADPASEIYGEAHGFEGADNRILLARIYQAAGEKQKTARELKKAADCLDEIVRKANERLKIVREMQKGVD